jgi:hypothetical protein
MGASADELSGPSTAAAVAPIIDRVRMSIARAVGDRAPELVERYGLPPAAGGTLAMLRHLGDRTITQAQLDAVFRYQPPEAIAAAIAAGRVAGILVEDPTELRLADAGRALMAEVLALTSEIVDERWAAETARLDRLLALTAAALEAATASAGDSFAVLHPLAVAPEAIPALVLAERLTALRFHRADAHAAAWQAAGLTVSEAAALAEGPQRDAIEADTNVRAAAPYEALSTGDRLALIADLGALPG